MLVKSLRGKFHRLLEKILEKMWQHRGIETDGVLYKKDCLHADLEDIVLSVHTVLYKLDDGKYQIHIPKPGEHVVNSGKILIRYASSNLL